MRRAVTAACLVVALVAMGLGLSPCRTGDEPTAMAPRAPPVAMESSPSREHRDRPRAAVADAPSSKEAAPTTHAGSQAGAGAARPAESTPTAARAKSPATPLPVLVLHADGTPAPGAIVTAYGGPVASSWGGYEVKPMYMETDVAGADGRATLPPRGREFGVLRAVWNGTETGAATDGAGRFTIRGLPEGRYTVISGDESSRTASRATAEDVPTGAQDVSLVAAGTVRLRFVSAEDGRPVRIPVGWFRVLSGPRGPSEGRVWSEDAPGPDGISTALDGPGTYALTVGAIGIEEARVESVTVVADRNVEIDVPIPPRRH